MYDIQIERLSFTYPDREIPAVSDINLHIEEGEIILICGKNGSGKSTLIRQMKKEIIPAGDRTGKVLFGGKDITEIDHFMEEVAIVFQNPDAQIVMEKVYNELAFSMENMGFDVGTMRKRIAEVVNFFGIEDLLYKKTAELSGGERQLVNLAAAIMLRPKVLLLDEPTGQLDPINTREFINIIKRINDDLSITIVIAEHKFEEFLSIADNVAIIDEGKIIYYGSPAETISGIWGKEDSVNSCFIPSLTKLYMSIHKKFNNELKNEFNNDKLPFTVKEFRKTFDGFRIKPTDEADKWTGTMSVKPDKLPIPTSVPSSDFDVKPNIEKKKIVIREPNDTNYVIRAEGIIFDYPGDTNFILDKFNLNVKKGEILTIMGSNGSGKTTALKLLAGILKPYQGKVYLNDKSVSKMKAHDLYNQIGYLDQNHILQFTCDNVKDELVSCVKNIGMDTSNEKITEIIELFSLGDIMHRHPYDLSAGQQQKLALASILLKDTNVLLLDEPTKGVDPISKKNFGGLLRQINSMGVTIVMINHDIEFVAEYSHKCAMIFDGSITFEAAPGEFFSSNYFYTTNLNTATRNYFKDAILYEDVMDRWGIPLPEFLKR